VNEADALLLRAARGQARGPDAVWAAAQHRHRHHPLLLGAALVLFVAAVVAVTAISLSMRSTHDSTPPFVTTPPVEVTGTAMNDQLHATVAIEGPELHPGSTVTARATVRNVTSDILDVNVEPDDLMSLRWSVMPAHLLDSAHGLGITGWDASAAFFRSQDEPDGYATPEEVRAALETPPKSVELAPGESTTFEGVLAIDEKVRTGAVTLRFTPRLGRPPPGAPPRATAGQPLRVMIIEVPVTVLARTDGTITDGDAEVVALEDPRVQRWLSTGHSGWPGTLNGETSNTFGGGPRPDAYEALAVITRDRAQGKWPLDLARELSLPGFVVHVDRQGAVTVEYMVD
jgi:hypothetical protein